MDSVLAPVQNIFLRREFLFNRIFGRIICYIDEFFCSGIETCIIFVYTVFKRTTTWYQDFALRNGPLPISEVKALGMNLKRGMLGGSPNIYWNAFLANLPH